MPLVADYAHVIFKAAFYRMLREADGELTEPEKVFLEAFDSNEAIEECARLLKECERSAS